MVSKETIEKIRNLAEAPIEAVFTDPTYGKVCKMIIGSSVFEFQMKLYNYISLLPHLLICCISIPLHLV